MREIKPISRAQPQSALAAANPLVNIKQDLWWSNILPYLATVDLLSLAFVRRNTYSECMPTVGLKGVLEKYVTTKTLPLDQNRLRDIAWQEYETLNCATRNEFMGRCFETKNGTFCAGTISPKADRCLLIQGTGMMGEFINKGPNGTFIPLVNLKKEIANRDVDHLLNFVRQTIWNACGEKVEKVLVGLGDGLLGLWQRQKNNTFASKTFQGYQGTLSHDGRFLFAFQENPFNNSLGITSRKALIYDLQQAPGESFIEVESFSANRFHFISGDKSFYLTGPDHILRYTFEGIQEIYYVLGADQTHLGQISISDDGAYIFEVSRSNPQHTLFLLGRNCRKYEYRVWAYFADGLQTIDVTNPPNLGNEPDAVPLGYTQRIVPFTSLDGQQRFAVLRPLEGQVKIAEFHKAQTSTFRLKQMLTPQSEAQSYPLVSRNEPALTMSSGGGTHAMVADIDGTVRFWDTRSQEASLVTFPQRHRFIKFTYIPFGPSPLDTAVLQQWSHDKRHFAIHLFERRVQDVSYFSSTMIFWVFAKRKKHSVKCLSRRISCKHFPQNCSILKSLTYLSTLTWFKKVNWMTRSNFSVANFNGPGYDLFA